MYWVLSSRVRTVHPWVGGTGGRVASCVDLKALGCYHSPQREPSSTSPWTNMLSHSAACAESRPRLREAAAAPGHTAGRWLSRAWGGGLLPSLPPLIWELLEDRAQIRSPLVSTNTSQDTRSLNTPSDSHLQLRYLWFNLEHVPVMLAFRKPPVNLSLSFSQTFYYNEVGS